MKESNILSSHVGYSKTKCGAVCKKLSCSFFTTSNTATPPVCTVYGDLEKEIEVQGDVIVWKDVVDTYESPLTSI